MDYIISIMAVLNGAIFGIIIASDSLDDVKKWARISVLFLAVLLGSPILLLFIIWYYLNKLFIIQDTAQFIWRYFFTNLDVYRLKYLYGYLKLYNDSKKFKWYNVRKYIYPLIYKAVSKEKREIHKLGAKCGIINVDVLDPRKNNAIEDGEFWDKTSTDESFILFKGKWRKWYGAIPTKNKKL